MLVNHSPAVVFVPGSVLSILQALLNPHNQMYKVLLDHFRYKDAKAYNFIIYHTTS